jgi:hypothetical protein
MRFMKISGPIQYGLLLAAAVAIVGCSNGALQSPPVQQVQSALSLQQHLATLPGRRLVITTHPDRRRSWMAPDAKKKALLYVSDQDNAVVDVYSYPKGALKGTLTGFADPEGECVDKAQDVFITDFRANVIYEYAHGGTFPVAVLADPGGQPIGCSVNRKNGNLAVSNIFGISSAPGNIEVYAGAQGEPTMYVNPAVPILYFCGYDNKGNLFIDGLGNSDNFLFEELPNNSSTFTNVTLSQTIYSPGGVQWDGKYVAVGDYSHGGIYQFTISGSTGTLEGSTPLNNSFEVNQFWIQGAKVTAGSSAFNPHVDLYDYPAGGNPIKTWASPPPSQEFSPVGAAVSKAK